MAETKKVAAKGADVKKEEVKADAAAAAKEASKAAEAPKTTAKKTAAKKAATKKTTTKKAAAKKTEAKTTTKTAGRKAAVKTEVNLQFAGKSYTPDDLVQSAKDVWQYDLGRKPEDFKTVSLYVKPEESRVYYVINDDVDGSFGI